MPPKTENPESYIPKRPRPMAESQLVILYMLSKLGTVTDISLLDFLTEARVMNYLDMMPALKRLAQEGAVTETQEGPYRRYGLQPAGRELLNLYGARIPFSVREAIDSRQEEWLAALKAQRDFRSDMTETPRGDYEVSLRMMEHDRPLMAVTLCVPSSDVAARLCRRWQSEGGEVFSALLRPLLEEDEQ